MCDHQKHMVTSPIQRHPDRHHPVKVHQDSDVLVYDEYIEPSP